MASTLSAQLRRRKEAERRLPPLPRRGGKVAPLRGMGIAPACRRCGTYLDPDGSCFMCTARGAA